MKKQPIAGQVRDRGRPAAGAEVVLESLLSAVDHAFARKVVTGADGRFDFGPQSAWFYAVTATAPGRRPAATRLHVGDPGGRPIPHALVLELGDCDAGISGTVLDESGRGVPDARVRSLLLDAPENGFNGPFVESDQRGHFELCSRPGPLRLRVDADGYGSVRLKAAATPERPSLEIRLAPEAVIIGRTVRRETGAPIPGVQLLLDDTSPASGATAAAVATALSDGQGRFEARGLRAGKYSFMALAADAMGRDDGEVVEVRAGEVKRGVIRRLDSTSMVDVLVLSRGKPVAGVGLVLERRGTDDSSYGVLSQPDGRATIHGVFRGENRFIVFDDGHGRLPYHVVSPTSLDVVTPRMSGVVLVLEPGPAPSRGPVATPETR